MPVYRAACSFFLLKIAETLHAVRGNLHGLLSRWPKAAKQLRGRWNTISPGL